MKPAHHLMFLVFIFAGCGERNREPKATDAPANKPPEVMKMDPQDILFTTPTLNDALPALGQPIPIEGSCQMHEDDWRQFEFVSPSFATEMAGELAAIGTIWKEQSVPLGDKGTAFRSVHVRKSIPKPLDIPMTLADFEKLFGGRASSMAVMGNDKCLRDVHAIQLKNVFIYGVIQGDRLTTLGIEPQGRFAITGETADRLEQFITKHNLRLIHWRSRKVFETPPEAIKYLRGNVG